MYTNAIKGTIQHENAPGEQTIFHKYCYDTVMANSSCITPAHLIPMPAENVESATDGVRDMELEEAVVPTGVGDKRAIEVCEQLDYCYAVVVVLNVPYLICM